MEENQRVRITKKILRQSLISILELKSIHQISVRELCNKAEINRTTFYRHYAGPNDLLKDIERSVIDEIENCIPDNEYDSLEKFTRMLQYYEENVSLIRLLLNNTTDPEFPLELINHRGIQDALKNSINKSRDENTIEYLYDFIYNGCISIVAKWLNKERREPPEQIALLIADTVQRVF